jgi:hypothetical protein
LITGTIRDTGKELFYSPQVEKAKKLAQSYTTLKWGKGVMQEGSILKFSQARLSQNQV